MEQNARYARYDFLRSTAENLKAGWVLTAHTMNDQAETFLLNLVRGSGVEGLGGMKVTRILEHENDGGPEGADQLPLRPDAPIPQLVRPLLCWATREDTENFCRGSEVEFRYDTMNEDMSFKRVRVRKMLLPMLKEFNPKIIETLARTAGLLQRYSGPATAEPKSEPPASTGGKAPDEISTTSANELAIAEIKELETNELHNIVRSWLKTRRGTLRSIGLTHIEAVERLVHSTKSGRTVELPGFGVVRKHGGHLIFEKIKVEK